MIWPLFVGALVVASQTQSLQAASTLASTVASGVAGATAIVSPVSAAAIGVNQMNSAAQQDVTGGVNALSSSVSSLGGTAAKGFESGVSSLLGNTRQLGGDLRSTLTLLNGFINNG